MSKYLVAEKVMVQEKVAWRRDHSRTRKLRHGPTLGPHLSQVIEISFPFKFEIPVLLNPKLPNASLSGLLAIAMASVYRCFIIVSDVGSRISITEPIGLGGYMLVTDTTFDGKREETHSWYSWWVNLRYVTLHSYVWHPALQGAFVEHRSALERLPYYGQFEVLLVKTVEDLNYCDGLIIPGGGKRIASIPADPDHLSNREHHHRSIGTNIWSSWPFASILKEETHLGNMCGSHFSFSECWECKERRARVAQRNVGDYCPQWVGLSGTLSRMLSMKP